MLYFANLCDAYDGPVKACVDFLQENPMETMELGRYSVGDTGIFVNLMEYDTKAYEDGIFEAHRELADFQVVISGCEAVYFGDVAGMKQGEYHTEGDYLLCETDRPVEKVLLAVGGGAVFMPADAHMPGITADTPTHVRKAVFKIPVTLF